MARCAEVYMIPELQWEPFEKGVLETTDGDRSFEGDALYKAAVLAQSLEEFQKSTEGHLFCVEGIWFLRTAKYAVKEITEMGEILKNSLERGGFRVLLVTSIHY